MADSGRSEVLAGQSWASAGAASVRPDLPPAVAAPSAAVGARRWIVLGLLCLAFMCAYFDRQNLSIAVADKSATSFSHFFHLNDLRSGWLLSAFFWTYCLFQLPAGRAVDRFGAKKTLAAGFVLWSLTSAGTGLAGGFASVFALRALLGVGEAVVTPAGMRWIRFNMPESRRGTAVGIYMASAKVGPAVGSLIAGPVLMAVGWRPMFLVMGLGCLVWLIPWFALVRDDDRALEQAQAKSATVPSVPMSAILRSPVIWGTIIGTLAYQYFLYLTMTWMPKYFADRFHMKVEATSYYAAFSFGGMALVAIISGAIADRLIRNGRDPVRVRRRFVIAGLLLGSTEVIGAFSHSPQVALFFAIFSICGLGLATANYWAITQTLIPGGSVGSIVGLQNCVAQIPGIVAPLLTGWLKQRTGNYQAPMLVPAILLVIAVCAYPLLMRREYAPRSPRFS